MNKKSLINKISLLYHIKMNGVMTWQKYDNEIIVISIKEADKLRGGIFGNSLSP